MSRSNADSDVTGHRKAGLAVSVLLHFIGLFWLLTMPSMISAPIPERPLMTIDLPPVVPEIVKIPEKPEMQAGERSETALGGGGGRPAKAMRVKPDLVPAPIDLPIPVVKLDLPPEIVVPTAPVMGPAVIGTDGAGTGSGTGAGAGSGSGLGSGSGTGAGHGDGAGGRGSGVGQLQEAEWIRRPTDTQMQRLFPELARYTIVSGTVRLSCRVDQANRAKDCRILSETPKGFNFGNAAFKILRVSLIRAPIVGKPDPNVRVSVTIAFENSPWQN